MLTTEQVLLFNTNEIGNECRYIFKCAFSPKIYVQFYLLDFTKTQT